MKVFIIMDSETIRMICSTRMLADKIVEAFSYLGLSIIEMEVIGEYHATH